MTKIQLRHDTAANFTSVNPVLLAGEAAVETDTNKIKIGDGTTAYNSLEYFGGELPDLSNYITTNAPQAPLEYVEEPNSAAVESNDSVYYAANPAISDDLVITYYEANDTGIIAKTTASGNGILNPVYMISYNGNLTNKTIKFTARNDEDYFTSYSGCYIGNTSATGVFTPYFCISTDSSNNYHLMEVTSPTLGPDQYGWTDGSRWVSSSYSYHSNSFYRTYYSPLAWSFEISIIDDNGTLKFNIKTRLKDGTLGNNVDYTPSQNTDISVLNTVVFPINMYQSSSTGNKNYDISKNGIFDLEGNQLWEVSGDTKKLKLNIGAGLAIQNGNLVNTNPTTITIDQTYNATSTNAQSGTAVAGAVGSKVDISSLVQCHVVIEAYSNGSSWYRIYDDGWCEEGGLLFNVIPNTWSSVNFINTFSSTLLNVQLTTYSGYSSFPDQFACYQNLTTTGMSIGTRYLSSNENATISWRVAGFVSQGA